MELVDPRKFFWPELPPSYPLAELIFVKVSPSIDQIQPGHASFTATVTKSRTLTSEVSIFPSTVMTDRMSSPFLASQYNREGESQKAAPARGVKKESPQSAISILSTVLFFFLVVEVCLFRLCHLWISSITSLWDMGEISC